MARETPERRRRRLADARGRQREARTQLRETEITLFGWGLAITLIYFIGSWLGFW